MWIREIVESDDVLTRTALTQSWALSETALSRWIRQFTIILTLIFDNFKENRNN